MGLLSNLEIFQEEHFFIIGTQKTQTKCIMGMIGLIQPASFSSFAKKTNFRNINEQNVHILFLICQNIMTFINSNVKV